MQTIDAKGIYYRDLNHMIKQIFADGMEELLLKNINGQRFIGDAISGKQRIIIEGTPGNDLAAYMDGLEIVVKANTQDGTGNTMNDGRVVVHGDAGDVTGYAMRGGQLFIKGNVGYRVGIHMKAFGEKEPIIVVGGKAGDFFGEYMAGGKIFLLGLNLDECEEIVGNFCGTGMHGGVMYIRGEVDGHKLGKEVRVVDPTPEDEWIIKKYVGAFAEYFNVEAKEILSKKFSKLIPFNKRPYENLYASY